MFSRLERSSVLVLDRRSELASILKKWGPVQKAEELQTLCYSMLFNPGPGSNQLDHTYYRNGEPYRRLRSSRLCN